MGGGYIGVEIAANLADWCGEELAGITLVRKRAMKPRPHATDGAGSIHAPDGSPVRPG